MEDEKGRDVQVCPYCLNEIFARDYSRADTLGNFSTYFHCPKCNFEGLPIIMYEKDLKKLRRKDQQGN